METLENKIKRMSKEQFESKLEELQSGRLYSGMNNVDSFFWNSIQCIWDNAETLKEEKEMFINFLDSLEEENYYSYTEKDFKAIHRIINRVFNK